jgi:hypothetical protein
MSASVGYDKQIPFEDGDYKIKIVEVELRKPKSSSMAHLCFKMEILNGCRKGEFLFHNIVVAGGNSSAVEFGLKSLQMIFHAGGLGPIPSRHENSDEDFLNLVILKILHAVYEINITTVHYKPYGIKYVVINSFSDFCQCDETNDLEPCQRDIELNHKTPEESACSCCKRCRHFCSAGI